MDAGQRGVGGIATAAAMTAALDCAVQRVATAGSALKYTMGQAALVAAEAAAGMMGTAEDRMGAGQRAVQGCATTTKVHFHRAAEA